MADDAKMIKGSEVRKADYQIEPLLLDRWSPRAMSGEEISEEELMRLFEAARSVFIQRPAVARSLCSPGHGALADVLRFACPCEQGVGEKRCGARGVHFAKVFRLRQRTVGHAFI